MSQYDGYLPPRPEPAPREQPRLARTGKPDEIRGEEELLIRWQQLAPADRNDLVHQCRGMIGPSRPWTTMPSLAFSILNDIDPVADPAFSSAFSVQLSRQLFRRYNNRDLPPAQQSQELQRVIFLQEILKHIDIIGLAFVLASPIGPELLRNRQHQPSHDYRLVLYQKAQ